MNNPDYAPYETLKEAGYKHIAYNKATKEHILMNESYNYEIFVAHRYHAGWALIYKNTHLEFCRSANNNDLLGARLII